MLVCWLVVYCFAYCYCFGLLLLLLFLFFVLWLPPFHVFCVPTALLGLAVAAVLAIIWWLLLLHRGQESAQLFLYTILFGNPSGHGSPRRKIVDVRTKKCVSCGPGDGEKLVDPWASGRKGQECPREIRTEKFIWLCCFTPSLIAVLTCLLLIDDLVVFVSCCWAWKDVASWLGFSRGQKQNRDSQRSDKSLSLFLGNFSTLWGDFPINYAESLENKEKITGDISKKSSGGCAPKLQISFPCWGPTRTDFVMCCGGVLVLLFGVAGSVRHGFQSM